MTKFKITVEIEFSDRWLRQYHPYEENAVGNRVLELLETTISVPHSQIEVETLK